MPISELFSLLIVSYFIGAIPFSVIISRSKGIDLRKVGSGNYGSTNVYRAMGFWPAFLVFFLDTTKGFVPVTIALNLQGHSTILPLIVGLIAIIAHLYSVFVGFKGGRGVATSVGVLMALSPDVCILTIIIGVGIILNTRMVSLSSLASSVLVPILLFLFSYPIEYVLLFGMISLIIILKHRTNIKRLIQGKENRV
ncbi:acyl-phosphate glycerol 3-phosphate acyltransferase [Candidatus Marinamargulisbacteria bacterium SCGC AAA071-K20]|nr:acyl-phosphate glycerol 3-phosphate acyltransferase [Candidatus Marinamargulisbacteria bacterium SCGC AAA071-K20]